MKPGVSPQPGRYFYPDPKLPSSRAANRSTDSYNQSYTSWANLAELSRAKEGPILLILSIDSTALRADWRSLKRVQHVRQLQLRFTTPLTQTLADSLVGTLANWPELNDIQVSATSPVSSTASGTTPPIDGKASAQLKSVHRLNFLQSGNQLRACIQLFSHCPSIFHLSVSDYSPAGSVTLPVDLLAFTTVRSLSIYGMGKIMGVEKFVSGFPALTALDLGSVGDGEQLTDALKRVPNLRKLSLSPTQGQNKISALRLGSLAQLDTLNLRFDHRVPEVVDSILVGLTTLRDGRE
ncbi:MAG: hypothetical protein EOO39_23560 [Cytophagaceae bacterium]|nr:MAG: hypothetical protein EOO39_23560 [Cytophagaceae bacterium]